MYLLKDELIEELSRNIPDDTAIEYIRSVSRPSDNFSRYVEIGHGSYRNIVHCYVEEEEITLRFKRTMV